MRRCIALNLTGLGYTEISPNQDVSFTAQAQLIELPETKLFFPEDRSQVLIEPLRKLWSSHGSTKQ